MPTHLYFKIDMAYVQVGETSPCVHDAIQLYLTSTIVRYLVDPVFKNSLFWCVGSGSAVLAIGSGSGFRVYPILDPSPIPKNPNPEIYRDEIWRTRLQKLAAQKIFIEARAADFELRPPPVILQQCYQ